MSIQSKVRLLALILHMLLSTVSFSQVLNIDLQAVDSLSLSDTSNLVYDVNGDICNLVIVRTELDSLKFYSNLGTEHIEKQNNEYRVWISSASSIMKISVPGMPLYDFLLPKSEFPNSVWFLNLRHIKGENIIYKDTIQIKPFLSITSDPPDAKVYINKKFAGSSPIIVSDPEYSIISYKVRKLGYRTINGTDTLESRTVSLSIKLDNLKKAKRWFLTYSGLLINNAFHNHNYYDFDAVHDITIGKIGKTGWYTSARFNRREPVIRWYPNHSYYTGVYDTYPYTTKKFQLVTGITQQITNSLFVTAGAGYSEYQNGDVSGYYEDMQFYMTSLNDYSYSGFCVDVGIMSRIFWLFVISGNISFDFGTADGKTQYKGLVYGAGAGINFGVKK